MLCAEAEIPWPEIAFPSVAFALRKYLEDRAAGHAGAAFQDHRHARPGPLSATAVRSSLWHNARRRKTRHGVAGMTFVVTESCIKCKYMDCVEVCPVDCFHEGPNFLVIDPEECIDCTLCEPECPVEAIYSEEELPAGQEQFLAINAELTKATGR